MDFSCTTVILIDPVCLFSRPKLNLVLFAGYSAFTSPGVGVINPRASSWLVIGRRRASHKSPLQIHTSYTLGPSPLTVLAAIPLAFNFIASGECAVHAHVAF